MLSTSCPWDWTPWNCKGDHNRHNCNCFCSRSHSHDHHGSRDHNFKPHAHNHIQHYHPDDCHHNNHHHAWSCSSWRDSYNQDHGHYIHKATWGHEMKLFHWISPCKWVPACPESKTVDITPAATMAACPPPEKLLWIPVDFLNISIYSSNTSQASFSIKYDSSDEGETLIAMEDAVPKIKDLFVWVL